MLIISACGQFQLVAALRGRGAGFKRLARGRDQVGARHGVGVHHQKSIGARRPRRFKAAAQRRRFPVDRELVQLDHSRARVGRHGSRTIGAVVSHNKYRNPPDILSRFLSPAPKRTHPGCSQHRFHGGRDLLLLVMCRNHHRQANSPRISGAHLARVAQISQQAHRQVGEQRSRQQRDCRRQHLHRKCVLQNQNLNTLRSLIASTRRNPTSTAPVD